jgi:AraC-like DNA-binding protein
LSRSVFADRFAHHACDSPMQYIVRWRMQLATRRLENPGVSIAQVGAEVGYESESAFNRAFKKIVGLPPGTWRKERLSLIEAAKMPLAIPVAMSKGSTVSGGNRHMARGPRIADVATPASDQ